MLSCAAKDRPSVMSACAWASVTWKAGASTPLWPTSSCTPTLPSRLAAAPCKALSCKPSLMTLPWASKVVPLKKASKLVRSLTPGADRSTWISEIPWLAKDRPSAYKFVSPTNWSAFISRVTGPPSKCGKPPAIAALKLSSPRLTVRPSAPLTATWSIESFSSCLRLLDRWVPCASRVMLSCAAKSKPCAINWLAWESVMCSASLVLLPPISNWTSKWVPLAFGVSTKLTALAILELISPLVWPPVNRPSKSLTLTSKAILSMPLLMRASRPSIFRPPVTNASVEASSKVTLPSPVKLGRPLPTIPSMVSPDWAPKVIVMPSPASCPLIATASMFRVCSVLSEACKTLPLLGTSTSKVTSSGWLNGSPASIWLWSSCSVTLMTLGITEPEPVPAKSIVNVLPMTRPSVVTS